MIGLIVYIGICLLIGYFGRDKKFGFVGNFFAPLLLTPLIGLIILLVQSDSSSAVAKKNA